MRVLSVKVIRYLPSSLTALFVPIVGLILEKKIKGEEGDDSSSQINILGV